MSTDARRTEEHTDLIGIDADGAEHRWHAPTREIILMQPDETRQRAPLADMRGDTLDDYCNVVDEECGWTVCHYWLSTAELVARGLTS